MAEPDFFSKMTDLLRQASEPGAVPAPGAPDLGHQLPQGLLNVATVWPVVSTLYLATVVAAYGLGLLWFMLAPERNRRAVETMSRSPIPSYLLGLGVVVIDLVLLAMLTKAGIHRGVPLLSVLPLFMAALGMSVCARALGERVLPDRGPVVHVALGLVALIMPMLSPAFLIIIWIAGPLGLGAWLRANPSKRGDG